MLGFMKSVRKILGERSSLSSLERRLTGYEQLCLKVKAALPPPLDQQLKATVLQSGVLSLFTASPVWASRMRYAAPRLTEQLKKEGLIVERVRTRILPNQITRKRRYNSSTLSLSRDNREILRRTAAAISDPELSGALLKLSRHGND
jgi:hypothetical protein